MSRLEVSWIMALPRLRVVRYGCVGLAVSVFYSLLVCALVRFLIPTTASIGAFVVTLPLGYLGHGRISFSDSAYDSFQPLRFALTTASSFAVSVGGMYWITDVLGHSYLLGIAWNWMVIPLMNFTTYLFWVFRRVRNRGMSV